jgi:hypothetical protein
MAAIPRAQHNTTAVAHAISVQGGSKPKLDKQRLGQQMWALQCKTKTSCNQQCQKQTHKHKTTNKVRVAKAWQTKPLRG